MGFQAQKLFKILLIGDACLDKYHYGSCFRLSSEAPVPVFKLLRTEVQKGMILNVEKNLRAFGIAVDTISNDFGLITKERFIDNRSGQHLLRLDTGEDKLLPSLSLNDLNIDNYNCVAISDYDKGSLPYEMCNKISKLCLEKNKRLFVDSKKSDLSCFEGAIIKINEEERKKTQQFPKIYDLVTTLGSQGACWNETTFSAYKVEVFDVCGAGDTFFAALISEFLKTNNMMSSIIFANGCASITVQKNGCYSLRSEEIKGVRNGLCG